MARCEWVDGLLRVVDIEYLRPGLLYGFETDEGDRDARAAVAQLERDGFDTEYVDSTAVAAFRGIHRRGVSDPVPTLDERWELIGEFTWR